MQDPSVQKPTHSLPALTNYVELSFAAITETWLKDSSQLTDDLIDLKGRAGLGVITKNQAANDNDVKHGGVDIIFSKSKCSFSLIRHP